MNRKTVLWSLYLIALTLLMLGGPDLNHGWAFVEYNSGLVLMSAVIGYAMGWVRPRGH